MIIDASELFRETLISLLRSPFPGISFEEASTSAEALSKLNDFLPHIIFLDIKLPVQSGLALIKQIKDIYPDVIIIAITNYDLPEYKEKARQQEADYFLSKDTSTAKEILALIESITSDKKFDLDT